MLAIKSYAKTHAHYWRWSGMRQRCYNPNNEAFYCYGARRIKVCKEWHDFKTFQKWCLKHYTPGTTLDRIDNNKSYSPKNCKFSTLAEQFRNRRITPAYRAAARHAAQQANIARISKYGNPKTRTNKFCKMCSKFLPLKLFYNHRNMPDKKGGRCIKCARKHDRYRRQFERNIKENSKLQPARS